MELMSWSLSPVSEGSEQYPDSPSTVSMRDASTISIRDSDVEQDYGEVESRIKQIEATHAAFETHRTNFTIGVTVPEALGSGGSWASSNKTIEESDTEVPNALSDGELEEIVSARQSNAKPAGDEDLSQHGVRGEAQMEKSTEVDGAAVPAMQDAMEAVRSQAEAVGRARRQVPLLLAQYHCSMTWPVFSCELMMRGNARSLADQRYQTRRCSHRDSAIHSCVRRAAPKRRL